MGIQSQFWGGTTNTSAEMVVRGKTRGTVTVDEDHALMATSSIANRRLTLDSLRRLCGLPTSFFLISCNFPSMARHGLHVLKCQAMRLSP